MLLRPLSEGQSMMNNVSTNRRPFLKKLLWLNGANIKTTLKVKNKILFQFKRHTGDHANPNYHKTLGVPLTATKKEIKATYFELAKKYHPDANPGDPNAKQRFQEISDAYEALIGNKKAPSRYHPYNPSKHKSYSHSERARKYKSDHWTHSTTPNSFQNFSLPPNVRMRDVVKQVFLDIGFENIVKNWEKTTGDVVFAVKAARRGEWESSRTFVQDHKLVTICFIFSLMTLVYYPWIINVTIFLLWYVYYFVLFLFFMIVIFGRSHLFTLFVIKPLHTRFMIKAQRAAKRKNGS